MTVLVTGAEGFIAKCVIGMLLEERYKVIGTVESERDVELLERQFHLVQNLSFKIVNEIGDTSGFENLFKEAGDELRVVIHMAAPQSCSAPDYENTMLNPTIQGTRNLLNAIANHCSENVERVVITSSALAVQDSSRMSKSESISTEESWNPVTRNNYGNDPILAYAAAEKFSELAAWHFMKERKDDIKFGLSTICPTRVFGPRKFDEDIDDISFIANEPIYDLLHSEPDKEFNTDFFGEFVDVRDLAKAHLVAFQKDSAIGQRLVVSAGRFDSQKIVEILNHTFPQFRRHTFEGTRAAFYDENMDSDFDSTKSENILEISYKSLDETVYDTAAQILRVEMA